MVCFLLRLQYPPFSPPKFAELKCFADTLESKIAALEYAIDQKNAINKILQDQIVTMADESMQGAACYVFYHAPRPARLCIAFFDQNYPLYADLDKLREAAAQEPAPWSQLQDENGHTYYFNSLTNVSSWDPPAGYALSVDGQMRRLIE